MTTEKFWAKWLSHKGIQDTYLSAVISYQVNRRASITVSDFQGIYFTSYNNITWKCKALMHGLEAKKFKLFQPNLALYHKLPVSATKMRSVTHRDWVESDDTAFVHSLARPNVNSGHRIRRPLRHIRRIRFEPVISSMDTESTTSEPPDPPIQLTDYPPPTSLCMNGSDNCYKSIATKSNYNKHAPTDDECLDRNQIQIPRSNTWYTTRVLACAKKHQPLDFGISPL